MKISYASVVVHIGAPYNRNIVQSFKVKEGSSYIKQGMLLGRILISEFVEHNFSKPTQKDYRYVENISKIKVKRYLASGCF